MLTIVGLTKLTLEQVGSYLISDVSRDNLHYKLELSNKHNQMQTITISRNVSENGRYEISGDIWIGYFGIENFKSKDEFKRSLSTILM